MAKYFLHVKVFSRGKGSRVTRAAAYRAGERIRDERTSEVYNHCDRKDVLHKEIVLPSELAGRTDASWARGAGHAVERGGARRGAA
jgi:MobA/MobL family